MNYWPVTSVVEGAFGSPDAVGIVLSTGLLSVVAITVVGACEELSCHNLLYTSFSNNYKEW